MSVLNWPRPDGPPRENSVKQPIWRASQPRPTRTGQPIMGGLIPTRPGSPILSHWNEIKDDA